MFEFNEKITELSEKAQALCADAFLRTDRITEYNQQKMLKAFIDNHVSESLFAESTGYGYSDRGRETLERVFADAFKAEAALVRYQFTCGTHTLAVALFGVLRPGDTLLCVSGTPYDTIQPVIGISGNAHNEGSLRDFNITYKQVDLMPDGTLDFEKIEEAVKREKPAMVYIQRSRGYSLRPSISVEEIGRVAEISRENSDAVVFVDNCYGEWTEEREPTEVGADLIAGSLIKNPGGGIAKTGGYIAGKRDLVEKCAYRLTCPGIGGEVGATLGHTREMFLGAFNAPHAVGEAIKTAVFTAALFSLMGFDTTPSYDEPRHDIIQAVKLTDQENLIAFCRGLQKGSPIDSFVVPEPSDMPGYDSQVIMAAGAFTLGSTIEISADAPLREPYAVWLQGGLNYHSAKVGVMSAASEVLKNHGKL